MNTVAEKKTPTTSDAIAATTERGTPASDIAHSFAKTASKKTADGDLRDAILALDAERSALIKNTIETIKPGKPFDSSVIREINKLENRKNRLVVARLSGLLRKNASEVQAIVHQIIEL
jgi:hypothetical protein